MRFLPFDPQNRPFSGNLLQFSPFFCYMLYGYNGAVLYAPWTDTMQKEGLPVKKKVFALALALILCLGILPLETLAGEPGPWQGGQTGHTHDAYGGILNTWTTSTISISSTAPAAPSGRWAPRRSTI